MNAIVAGFSLGLSLILAIGAQNAFVLRQGVQRQYLWMVCTICAGSDAILISAGVFGFGELIEQVPQLLQWAKFGGAAFLLAYGFFSFRSAFTQRHNLTASKNGQQSRWQAALACLAFTWLNPHVYLDTVVLLGSVAAQFQGQLELFALGAISASFVFFYALGFGARALSPLFLRPRAWQVLEFLIGTVMWALAALLLLG
ncbi:LysE/ArgO family amino acid transporter [uncultured Ferrimonas sp.]|uniref:LysE/ArgO family amino acid transporter n=1 Tax=uncultured Ferrimonas sp. TaxID=432640 RepID=UPI0026383CCD|nr:LysE/ArgO family amino acid transporter [uncultured Ferrimonas sp.]